MVDTDKLDRISIIVGYKDLMHMLAYLIMPTVLGSLFLSIFLMVFVKALPTAISLSIFVIGVAVAILYPYAKYVTMQQDIHNHLHYFITYAGTISTMKVSRQVLFKRIAENKAFGEISNIFEKIIYLAKSWNLGFAISCRTMAHRTPSRVLADFLDRLAVIMDFGEDLDNFLFDEQKSVLEDYSVEYHKSLETIKMLQELFMAITISFAFVISILLLAPLLMNVSMEKMMLYCLMAIIIIDALLVLSIRSFLPRDDLFYKGKDKNPEQTRIKYWFWICLAISAIIFGILFIYSPFSFVINFSIAIVPLLYPGMLSLNEEERIKERDGQFPIFIRVLGAAIEVRNGGVVSALKSTQIHDFGVLNPPSISLYRRLKLGCDKFRSWEYFAVESGSNIIANFIKIFSESVYLGGKAEKVGEMVSNNVEHLVSLRKLRWQIASGSRGIVYGSALGITATIYISEKITELLLSLFTPTQSMSSDMGDFLALIMPSNASINFSFVMAIIGIMIIVNTAASAFMIKFMDSGAIYSALVDFVIMMALTAVISWFAPQLVNAMLPNVAGSFGAAAANTPG